MGGVSRETQALTTSMSQEQTPPPSVGEYTTASLSFAEDLVVYREAGAVGIGIDARLKLGGRLTVRDEELEAFRSSGLNATFLFPGIATVLR